MKYVQDRPNTVKVELTEGCNLYCGMCGLRGIRSGPGGPYKFLTVETAMEIARRMADAEWNSKMEFALRGEPLMNPNAADIIAAFRGILPRTAMMLTSNAIPLLKPPGVRENIKRLFEAGLNVLALDDYKSSKKAVDQAIACSDDWPVTAYGAARKTELEAGPSPYEKVKPDVKRIIIIEDFEAAALDDREVGTKHVNNHCGAGSPPLEEPMHKRCARPFREMVIRCDGGVALCCNEWRDNLEMGIVTDYKTLQDAWNNKVLTAMRKMLMKGERSEQPCAGCNERTYRNGLLPDKQGQKTMPRFTQEDAKAIAVARRSGPRTAANLREWEKEDVK